MAHFSAVTWRTSQLNFTIAWIFKCCEFTFDNIVNKYHFKRAITVLATALREIEIFVIETFRVAELRKVRLL